MNQRAAIYARVSSDDQRGNYSIPTQVEECLRYAQSQGYSIVGSQLVDPKTGRDVSSSSGAVSAFVDDASGTSLVRPSLDALRDFIDRVGVDVVIVYAVDRLTRDTYDLETLIRSLETRNVKVEFVRGGKFDDTPIGRFARHTMAFVGEQENWNRIDRSRRGKRAKAQNGRFVAGRPPYGYKLDDSSLAGLAVVEEEAEIIRRIFNHYSQDGLSVRGISELLTGERIPSPTGRSTWGKSSVSKILRNETYAGRNYFNKHRRNGRLQELRSREDWIPIETTPLVERPLFEEVKERLHRNAAVRRQEPRRFYLLGGMVFCADCGRPYVTQTQPAGRHRRKTDAPSYRHRAKEGHCRNRTISARKIEPVVWDRIIERLLDPENLRKGYEESLEQNLATTGRQRRRLETLGRALEKQEQKRTNLIDAYVDPEIRITKAEYSQRRSTIEGEIKTLEADISSLRDQLTSVDVPPEYETIKAFSKEIRDQLGGEAEITPEQRRRILQLLHVRIFIPEHGDLRLEGWFEPSGKGHKATSY